jgi:hypothetical protein
MLDAEIALSILITIVIVISVLLLLTILNKESEEVEVSKKQERDNIADNWRTVYNRILTRPNGAPLRLSVRLINSALNNTDEEFQNNSNEIEQDNDNILNLLDTLDTQTREIQNNVLNLPVLPPHIEQVIRRSFNQGNNNNDTTANIIPISPIFMFPGMDTFDPINMNNAPTNEGTLPTRYHIFGRGFNPRDDPNKIRPDAENVHDSEVNKAILKTVNMLREKYSKSEPVSADIGYYIARRRSKEDMKLSPINSNDFQKQLKKFEDEKKPVFYFKITPIEAVNLAWHRSNDEGNMSNKDNIKESIIHAIMDPSHVCSHGMVTSVIGALDGTDQMNELPKMVSMQFTRSMVSETAGKKYQDLLQDTLLNKNLDNSIRCAAMDNLNPDVYKDHNFDYLKCGDMQEEEKSKGTDVLKHRIRPKLHAQLEKIYTTDKYKPFRKDIDAMIDMM